MDIQSAPVIVTPITDGFRVATFGPIHTNTDWLEREFKNVVDARPKNVELDLGKTGYVSSWGLGILVAFRSGIVKKGGSLRVTAIQNDVLNTLKYACLHQVFNISPNVVIERGS